MLSAVGAFLTYLRALHSIILFAAGTANILMDVLGCTCLLGIFSRTRSSSDAGPAPYTIAAFDNNSALQNGSATPNNSIVSVIQCLGLDNISNIVCLVGAVYVADCSMMLQY